LSDASYSEGGDEGNLDKLLEETRLRLKTLVPDYSQLPIITRKLPGVEYGLKEWELNNVERGLERVWHIMRLLRLLSRYFGEKLFFGGGSILNYIYMVKYREPPRLTFVLDSAWYREVKSKRVILKEMAGFNKWLAENGAILEVPTSTSKKVTLLLVEYDVEKDFFPELLSLRMPVITRFDGRPFHEFLNIRDYNVIRMLRKVFNEVLGVEDPRIDYVRFEVSLNPAGMQREEVMLEDLFGLSIKTWITSLEYQLASKITYKVGREFGAALEYNLHDILKAVLDLRLLKYVDSSEVKKYVENVSYSIVEHNLKSLLKPEGRKLWDVNYHYTLIRRKYTLEQLVGEVEALLENVLR